MHSGRADGPHGGPEVVEPVGERAGPAFAGTAVLHPGVGVALMKLDLDVPAPAVPLELDAAVSGRRNGGSGCIGRQEPHQRLEGLNEYLLGHGLFTTARSEALQARHDLTEPMRSD